MRRHLRQIVRVTIRLLCGDALEQLRLLEENSVDAVVTDPPYGINFMGKAWDGAAIIQAARRNAEARAPRTDGRTVPRDGLAAYAGSYDLSLNGNRAFQAWCETWAAESLHVAKPGAHLLAFGGTRTFHRLACAIEDAGWEIRDCLMWVYGSGFPKSLDVSKAIDKAAGAERVDAIKGGHLGISTGGGDAPNEASLRFPTPHAIDRGALSRGTPATDAARQWQGWGTGLKPAWEPIILARKPLDGTVAENVQKWGTGALNIDGCRVSAGDFEPKDRVGAAKLMEDRPWQQQQREEGRPRIVEGNSLGRWPANLIHDGSEEVVGMFPQSQAGKETQSRGTGGIWSGESNRPCGPQYGDLGSAARFFYCAKASKEDRNEGLEVVPPRRDSDREKRDGVGGDNPRNRTNKPRQNLHPTVKPTSLMCYLCRLVTPPGGTALDPFMGSGSTGKACVLEGFAFIGIDNVPEYVEIARRRIEGTAPLFVEVKT